jgi:uncharacterized membrane protein
LAEISGNRINDSVHSPAFGSWGVIALLIAVTTQYYMYQNPKARMGLPSVGFDFKSLQLVLIYWAYQYTFCKSRT